MDRAGRGGEGRGGVFTGRTPSDKGRVKIKMNFNKKKKKNLCVFPPDVKQCHGACALLSETVFVWKKA